MQLSTALDHVYDFLRNHVRHTGASGFEGLVARVLEVATGQRFRIAGSGYQEGQDLRSEPGIGNLIKVEAKHYARDARLDLRELEAELLEASRAATGMDLWVLATSTRMLNQHSEKLEESARRLNVEILQLDMGNDGLPRLAVLMAAHADAAEAWCTQHAITLPAPAKEALEAIRNDAQFNAAVEQLRGKLNSTLLGYEDTRRRAKRTFVSVMTDRGDSVARFNQDVALRAAGARPINRGAITAALDTWWNAGSPTRGHAAALGEEGVGKTWAAMGWALAKVEADELPLFLPFNAFVSGIRDGESLQDYLSRLLAQWTQIGTPDSWAGRLSRWLSKPSAKPILVLLADGLNERPNVNWPTFFRILEDRQWRSAVAVIATDRPGHWRPRCAMAGLGNFHQVEIAGYTDAELREALQDTNIQLSRIAPQLQELIRKPRYCRLVATHFEEMEREGDLSVERLIFLDNRYRFQEKRGLPLSSGEFVDVICRLAEKYRERTHLTGRDIQELLPRQDEDGRVHQEIIDGGLLVEREGGRGTFALERTRLVYGLGMVLADDIENASRNASVLELRERIASWFEPHREMELKVAVCASAVFHALIDPQYPRVARRELLRYWLTLRNWEDQWHETSLQCIVRCPEDFVDIAEEFWQSAHDERAAQELLGWAFTKYRDHPRVHPVLVAAVERWLGFVNPCGHPLLRHDDAHTALARQRIANRLGRAPEVNTIITVGGEPLFVTDEDGWARLPRLGLLIISAGPRAPFVRALVRWALASAAMGGATEYEEAAWVCRLAEDDLESPLLAAADRLLSSTEELARAAAHTLLGCLGTASARALQERSPLPESEFQRSMRERREADPCRAGFAWTDEECRRCMDRPDVPPQTIVRNLGVRLMDPDYPVSASLLERASRLPAAIDPQAPRSHMGGRTSEEHTLEEIWPLLSSRSPTVLADYLRRVMRTLPARTAIGRQFAAFWLDDFAIILGREEVDSVFEAMRAMEPEVSTPDSNGETNSEAKTVESYLLKSVLPHLSVEERLRRFTERSPNAQDIIDLQIWFEPMPAEAARQALDRLHSETDRQKIFRTLWFLCASRVSLTERDRSFLLSLMNSEDALIRAQCMRFTCYSNDPELGRRIVDLRRSYAADDSFWETRWGATCLYLFSAHLPFADVASRMHPALASELLQKRGNVAEEVTLYAETLDQEWHRIVAATDPQLAGLPIVIAQKRDSRLESDMPEFRKEAPQQIRFVNWASTWNSGPPPKQSIAEAFDTLNRDPTPELNRAARERVEWLTAAWRTPAFNWFGRQFSRQALTAIYQRHPELFERWTAPGLVEGTDGRKIRSRLGNFLVDLCAVLLEREPERGLELWRVLRSEQSVPIQFNMLEEAIQAPENPQVWTARQEELQACTDDRELSHLAYLAENDGKDQWLRDALASLVSSPMLWLRAKGLMLASYSNMTSTEFDDLVARADVANTWVEQSLKVMRENVRTNEFAQFWYRTYREEADTDKAWGAYEVVLKWADRRFHTWRGGIEGVQGPTLDRKQRFVSATWQHLERELNRDDKRKDEFLGRKISRGQVFPFVNR